MTYVSCLPFATVGETPKKLLHRARVEIRQQSITIDSIPGEDR